MKSTEDKMLRGTFLTDELRGRVEQRKTNVLIAVFTNVYTAYEWRKTRREKTEQGSSEYKK